MESGMWVGGVSKGRSCKGLLLCRALSSACGRLGRQGSGMGKGVRVGQRTLALVQIPPAGGWLLWGSGCWGPLTPRQKQ